MLNYEEQLLAKFRNMQRKHLTFLLGLDGCGASGKSTFAENLRKLAPHEITIVHMDDFIFDSRHRLPREIAVKHIGADIDWVRFRAQLLEPLLDNRETTYQRYDWLADKLMEWHAVPVGGIVIIEGVYSTCQAIAEVFDYKIWIDCPRSTRLERGLARDGEESRRFWEIEWMPMEDRYVAVQNPQATADLIIDGLRN
jgi:uridine kinase